MSCDSMRSKTHRRTFFCFSRFKRAVLGFRVRGFRVAGFEGPVCGFGGMPGLMVYTQNTSSATSEGVEGSGLLRVKLVQTCPRLVYVSLLIRVIYI